MKKSIYYLALFSGLVLLWDCTRVPLTGRRQMRLIPEAQMQAMSYQNYSNFLKENRVSTNSQYNSMVKNSGLKIRRAVETYMNKTKRNKKRIQGYAWEFNVVESDVINAWCMPGGKVVFYTGIMPICETELGTAVVMGHEIAHAIASHGNERMSQGLAIQGLGTGLAVAMQSKPKETQNLFNKAYGVGTSVGMMLPFSRKHESEADEMGLMFMAMAGYDPREATRFWKRMNEGTKGQRPPEFLSTHPSPDTRIENLEKWMPAALKYYNAAKK